MHLPYEPHIDIRDSIDYKQVMSQYKLGPNGGIMTSLNLFTTKFGQVLEACEEDEAAVDAKFLLIDTPGQIEIFTWSASGAIITQSFCNEYPTVFLYVIDCARVTSPTTFMSNMLYACSILYRESSRVTVDETVE